jgi:xanthine dehydrogenase large subunit
VEDTEPLRRVWEGAKTLGQLDQRRADAAAFNAQHRWMKRAVAMTPVKYGMAWAGIAATASVKIYKEDGSILINHHGACIYLAHFPPTYVKCLTQPTQIDLNKNTGCEVGQGIHTKVVQAAAYKLGVPMDQITIAPTATDKVCFCL